jgi:TonB family protein
MGSTVWAQQELAPSTDSGPIAIAPVSPKPDKDGVYLPGPAIPAPIVLQRVAAVYPPDASIDVVENVCVLAMVIDANGTPARIQVVHSSGTAFDDAAINAVKQSRFAPGTLDGKPVPVHIFVRTRFFNDKRIAYPRILNRYDPKGGATQSAGGNDFSARPVPMRSQPYDQPPAVLFQANAEYSQEARAAKIQGVVMVSVLVNEEGEPTDLQIVRQLGYGLDEKAIECVRKYRFKPAEKDGVPVPARITVEINFRLF